MSNNKYDQKIEEDQTSLEPTKSAVITQVTKPKKSKANNSSKQFLNLVKTFMIDGALLPEDKQLIIEERFNNRARNENKIKQQNIESIVKKTIPYCVNRDISQKVDFDWFSRYISLAEGISNPTMQDLWAKILAGELMRPGAYSYKAIKLFREMSIYDAKLLAKACSFSVKDCNNKGIRIISGAYQQTTLFNFLTKNKEVAIDLSSLGLSYTDILSLSESHLLYAQESESSVLDNTESLNFIYNGMNLSLVSKKSGVSLQFYKFTPVGAELAQLINDKKDESFLNTLKQKLSQHFSVNC